MLRSFSIEFINYINSYDIVFLGETWIRSDACLNLNINGYTSEHLLGQKSKQKRLGRCSGGISVYYKNYLKDKIQIVKKI